VRFGCWGVIDSIDDTMCFGKVGANKFCIEPCQGRKPHCGMIRHGIKLTPVENTAYIHATDNQVLCQPTLSLDEFSIAQGDAFTSEMFSQAQWEQVFASVKSGSLPKWLKEAAALQGEKDAVPPGSDVDDDQILSPIGTKSKHGVFDIHPNFSFKSQNSEDGIEKAGSILPLSSEDRLTKVEARLQMLKNKLTAPFLDIDAGYAVLLSDVVKLHTMLKTLASKLDAPGALEALDGKVHQLMLRCKQLDDARSLIITQLNRALSTQDDMKANLNNVMEEVAEVQSVPIQFETWMSTTEKTLETFRRRFGHIKPLLSRLNSSTHAPDEFVDSSASDKSDDLSLTSRLQVVEEKLKIVENRVVGAGVQLGSYMFQSFDDLLVWVRVNVPKGRFGLFVDGHSFLEFFTLSDHIDTEAGTAAFSNSQNAGFSTYIGAQLAISFKNLFPSVFGKGGSANVDDSECLPAISNDNKWNNGSTGLHHQLMRNMNDVSYQLDSSIKKVFKSHLNAKQLAIDCVTASKRFVIDLITFMSQEHSTWQQRGFSTKSAWQLVCQIVRRIIEDLQSARISARNVQDWEDVDFTTTLKCHNIMEAYVKHQFHAHPHVSSVITRHLAANFVKPDQTTEAKYASMEAKVAALATKVDSLTSKLALYVDKEKGKLKQDKENKEKSKKFKGKVDEAET